MVKIVASRVAAVRLVWIVAVLMIPIFFLGYFLTKSIQDEMKFTSKELHGMQFLEILAPVMLDAAAGKTTSENYETLRKHGGLFARAADESGEFEPLLKLISTPGFKAEAAMNLTHGLILQTGELSNIILDPNAATYYLGVAATQGMPDLVLRFKQLQLASLKASQSNDNKSLALVASANGALQENTRFLWSQVNAAKNAGRSSFEYIPILADFDLISKINLRRTDEIYQKISVNPESNLLMMHVLTDTSDTMLELQRGLWRKIVARFKVLKTQQYSALDKKMSFVVITSLISILIGIGSAVSMFRSTLKRLDDIQKAKLDAEVAQQEAENMATKLSGINEDIVSVNKELAHQMDMLKEAQDALVSKGRMEQLGQLTATIAHELRNPLGAVRTSAFLIERKVKGKDLGLDAQLARINNGVSRCDNIITQLLDFSRTRPLASRPADLDHWLLKTIEEEAKSLPAAVNIECDFNLMDQEVPFDSSRLQRAIINLLNNASEAMVGKGDDPSKFETSNPIIQVKTELRGGFAVVTVKDNGPGISAENLQKIREPLFTTKSFGTGLGLPAVEQIATQHSGRLEINSTLGEGAEFIIYLPINSNIEVAA